jgi:hypothetical protein
MPQSLRVPPRVAAENYIRAHPGEAFTTLAIRDEIAPGLKTQAISAALVRLVAEGYPRLARLSRTTWTTGTQTVDEKLRIIRERPLAQGARIEIVGFDDEAVPIARDTSGKLWTVQPLKAAT